MLVVTSEDEKSKKWKDFFGDFSQELQRKYKYWTNSFRVDKYFGKDDRSLFGEITVLNVWRTVITVILY